MGFLSALVGIGRGGVEVWATRALVRSHRSAARLVLTGIATIDPLINAVLGASSGSGVVGLMIFLMSLPGNVLLMVLLWGPESSRRYFADAPAAASFPSVGWLPPTPSSPWPTSAGRTPPRPMPVSPRPVPPVRRGVRVNGALHATTVPLRRGRGPAPMSPRF